MRIRVASAWVLVVLLSPMAVATPAPTNLAATFDSTTEVMTLTWSAVTGADHYVVYRSGIGSTTTATSYSEDLSDFSGTMDFHVTAVDTNGVESTYDGFVQVSRVPGPTQGPGATCGIVDISIFTNPPGVYPVIHRDCLPL